MVQVAVLEARVRLQEQQAELREQAHKFEMAQQQEHAAELARSEAGRAVAEALAKVEPCSGVPKSAALQHSHMSAVSKSAPSPDCCSLHAQASLA